MPRRSVGARRYLQRNAIQKGLMGGSRMWLGVLGLGVVTKALGKVTKSGPGPVLYSESLPQGAVVQIAHLDPPPTRRERRRARKARA